MTIPNEWALPTTCPLTLLPVRLETRFIGTFLCIRVIPDTVHADTFEPELTADELDAGRRYWHQMATTTDDHAAGVAAWRALATRFGPERAAWVARLVRQATPTTTGSPEGAVPFDPATRAASWTRAPQARCLPSRWRALGRRPGEEARVVGAPIPPLLPIGPDPRGAAGLAMPDWMRDFDEAVAVGMGLRLPLTPAMQTEGLDLLLVYGVDEAGTPAGGAQELSELIDAHYYTDGFRYLPPGTPTNNTDTVAAGYNLHAPEYSDAYQVVAMDPTPDAPDSAAAVLSAALGLPITTQTRVGLSPQWQTQIAAIAAAARVHDQAGGAETGRDDAYYWAAGEKQLVRGFTTGVGLASGADLREETIARAMTSALWATSWGYFLSQMLNGDQGEDFRRLNHSNIIDEDAYFRYLDHERERLQAQHDIVTNELGQDPGHAELPAFGQWWQDAIQHRATARNIKPEEAQQQLLAEVAELTANRWRHLHGTDGTDPVADWLVAARDLMLDRRRRYAYFRWEARQKRGDLTDHRLEDSLAGETAALYGDVTVRAARRHVVAHVRPGGALPSIAIGTQPYGILLTTALDSWAPTVGEERFRPVVGALRALRDTVWLPASARVPHLSPDPVPDVDHAQRTLVQLLATGPLAQQVFAREHIGNDYARNLWRFAQPDLIPEWENIVANGSQSSQQVLHDVGVAWRPRLAGLIGAEVSAPIAAALVDDGDGSLGAWLAWLADPRRTCADLRQQPDWATKGARTPLLYRLVRHSALREYATAALRVQVSRDLLGDWEHLEQELIDIRPGDDVATIWGQLERHIDWDGASGTIGEYLDSAASATDPACADLVEFRAAVGTLAANPSVETVERILRQFLDATSHRLDAWLTSMAHRRLTDLRAATPTGTLLGGYGWVEDLRPRPTQVHGDGTHYLEVSSDGYIHAPSLSQAVTAAVLRSGYQSNTGGASNPFAVNLSSRRARLAARTLDAVRNGQPVGSFTGYLFERRLQDLGAGQYTRAFRVLAPPATTALGPDGKTARSSPSTPTLTDGLVLRDKWRANDPALTNPLTSSPPGLLPTIQATQPGLYPAVMAALTALDDALDAAADALIAEAVHHTLNARPSRAAATLDALARGDGAVPELDLLATPRTGLTVGHRVIVPAPATAGRVAGWPASSPTQLRAAANPVLEAIVETLLPSPATVRCEATVTPDGGAAQRVTLRLADCDLSALDYVYEAPLVPPGDGTPDVPSSVRRTLTIVARFRTDVAVTTPVTFNWDRPPAYASADLSVPEFIVVCRLVRTLLHNCRALSASDLAPLDAAPTQGVDPDLSSRADAADAAIRVAANQIGQPATQQLAIQVAVNLGILGAVDAALTPNADMGLIRSIADDITRRVHALDTLPADLVGAARDRRRLQVVFGDDFLPLQAFTPGNAVDLTVAKAASAPTQPATATIRTWLQRVARVRTRVAALSRLRLALDALDAPDAPLTTLQLPTVEKEPWVGAAFGNATIAGPRVQATLIGPKLFDPTQPLAGLLVDEWTETIPAEKQFTGLAYHYTAPLSQPPQAILVAVAPDKTASTWTPETLEHILIETRDLAKIRAVDPDALVDPDARGGTDAPRGTGQLLPAFYLAINNKSDGPPGAADTVSTDVLPPHPSA